MSSGHHALQLTSVVQGSNATFCQFARQGGAHLDVTPEILCGTSILILEIILQQQSSTLPHLYITAGAPSGTN